MLLPWTLEVLEKTNAHTGTLQHHVTMPPRGKAAGNVTGPGDSTRAARRDDMELGLWRKGGNSEQHLPPKTGCLGRLNILS